jgi:hypothetical protein
MDAAHCTVFPRGAGRGMNTTSNLTASGAASRRLTDFQNLKQRVPRALGGVVDAGEWGLTYKRPPRGFHLPGQTRARSKSPRRGSFSRLPSFRITEGVG